MKVIVVEGPLKGSLREVPADDLFFLLEGVKYVVVYEIFGNHPTRKGFKLAAPFAVSEGSLEDVMAGSYSLEPVLKRELDCLKAYRWFPPAHLV